MNATTRRYDGRGTKLTCSGHGYGVKGERASVRACLLACFVSVEAAKLPARKILRGKDEVSGTVRVDRYAGERGEVSPITRMAVQYSAERCGAVRKRGACL